jgi:hypothetical protein
MANQSGPSQAREPGEGKHVLNHNFSEIEKNNILQVDK